MNDSTHTNDNIILTANDLKNRLKIGRDKAYALIKSPAFPSIQLGGRYLVTEKALSEWLDNNEYRHVIL